MRNVECFESKLPEILAIKDGDIRRQKMMPVATYLQEADDLYAWCQPDKAALVGAGLDWRIVEDIPVRAGALREIVSRCAVLRFTMSAAKEQWKEKAKALSAMRSALLHSFRFAYRENSRVMERISAIAGSRSHAAMIQDLNDLSVLGKNNPGELPAIGFDMRMLDKAAELAVECADILASSTLGSAYGEAKRIKDKAFTLLKLAVDCVYECGRYVFWQNEERKRGYSSAFLRKLRKRRSGNGNKSKNGKEALVTT